MKVTERPIHPGTLIKIRQLTGGNKGVLFVLENKDSEKLVVKFQNEDPVEAVAGTRIMERAGARTPQVRVAIQEDISALASGLQTIRDGFHGDCAAFDEAKGRFKHVLLMEFAEGVTLKDSRNKRVYDEFLAVICDEGFQIELGKIVAADTFAGNPDRMFAALIGMDQTVKGWYHEQNLFIAKDSRKPVAIDNAFQPAVMTACLPWGRYISGVGVQWGSVASACQAFARQEAALLFERFLTSAEQDHKATDKYITEVVQAIRNQCKERFVHNFTTGATEAMKLLLKRGQNWKGTLTESGAGDRLLQEFRTRRRLLRQMASGVDPKQAAQRAEDDKAYHKWVLTNECGLDDKAADGMLTKAVADYKEEYKRAKKRIR